MLRRMLNRIVRLVIRCLPRRYRAVLSLTDSVGEWEAVAFFIGRLTAQNVTGRDRELAFLYLLAFSRNPSFVNGQTLLYRAGMRDQDEERVA